MKPIVTIGMCLHNCQNTLSEAIKSVSDQVFPHEKMQLILVDDGSIDRTLKIAEDIVSKIDIQTTVFKTEWCGLGNARNLILANADGEYITWVDSDEILTPSYIQKQVEFMEKNPSVGITAGSFALVPGNLILNLELMPSIISHATFNKPQSLLWKTKKAIGTGGTTFRTKALRQVNGFDKRFKGVGEDINVVIRIRNSGWLIQLNDGVFYELHNGMSTLRDLWIKYYWYGCGGYQLHVETRGAFSLPRMSPPAGFITGFVLSIYSYKLKRQKSMFLLPLHYCFKTIAWMVGFMDSQIRSNLGEK
jgi:glycosyltransferase involved in cell wall biosynthesis